MFTLNKKLFNKNYQAIAILDHHYHRQVQIIAILKKLI